MKQKHHLLISAITLLSGLTDAAQAQNILATFEDGATHKITISTEATNPALFSRLPAVIDNPDPSGINPSAKCLGATNVANAGWWQNFVELKLNTPVTITAKNRYLSFLVYRSVQPKAFRVGINGYEEENQIYMDKVPYDASWDRVVIDLMATDFAGQTLSSLWIIFSCNWSIPTSGWGEATYAFDDFSLSGSSAIAPGNITVDPSVTFQEIDNFGASDCWLGQYIGKYWDEGVRGFIAEKLFSKEFDLQGNPKGIGLSNWRINLGAGTSEQGDASDIPDKTRRTECFLAPDGTYDWSKQAGHQYFMQKAREYGVEEMLLFSNSAPVQFTKNGKGFAAHGEPAANLNNNRYEDFAEFMATAAEHFRNEGYNITRISPVNEPQYDWDADRTTGKAAQEGSPWQNINIRQIVQALDASLQKRESPVRILMPEAGSYDKLYGGNGRASNQIEIFFNPSSSNYIGALPSVEPAVAGHSYWTFQTNEGLTTVRSNLREKAGEYGLKVHQTEWSMLDAAPETETGFPGSFDEASYHDIGLFMAKLIQCDLLHANVSSWAYWTAFSNEVYSQKNRFFLIRTTPRTSGGDYNPYAGDFELGGIAEPTQTLWALGQFSRFIRPGYRRIRLDGAGNMCQILGSAYLSPDGRQVVVVLVNTADVSQRININFNRLKGAAKTIRKYYLDEKVSAMTRATTPAESKVEAPVNITARSVTTLVYDIDPTETGVSSLPENDKEADKLSVSPNPAKAGHTLDISLPKQDAAPVELGLYTADGKQVCHTIVPAENKVSMHLPNNLSAGIYIVTADRSGHRQTARVVVQ